MIGSTQHPPARWQRAAAAAGQAIGGLQLDRWDLICGLGVVALFAGVWIWVHLGAALTLIGVLLIALGIAGARTAAADDASTTPGRG
ncbi:hypothetical protein ACGFIV_00910 [Sphaerisporangium sp. NPDC049003]|uniref:hypothetical protein n=1 Tax=Sphaerisporangium sp. NPDC049003 TaxID=3364517 RepID=UPI0037161E35